MLNLGNYLEDFQGLAQAGSIEVPADKVIPLPYQPCKLAMLFNWNVGNDTSFTSKGGGGNLIEDDQLEYYYGFGRQIIGQLFQSRSTELFPVSNLNQIVVRTRPGSAGRVYYAWFW